MYHWGLFWALHCMKTNYMAAPLADIFRKHNIMFSIYADDTQAAKTIVHAYVTSRLD